MASSKCLQWDYLVQGPNMSHWSHFQLTIIEIYLPITGPETLLCQSSSLGANGSTDGYFERDIGDAIEAYKWKCVRTINGILLLAFYYLLDSS